MINQLLKYSRLLAFVFLAACSAQVTPSNNPLTAQPYFAPRSATQPEPVQQAGDVRVELAETAKAKLADNLKFNQSTLSDNIRRALEANNLLTVQKDIALPSIIVTVTDVRVRSNFSAVMFGFMAGSDKIVGDVVVTEPGGKVVQSFNVNVSYALGGLAGGQDSTRMDWLYETFAQETVNTLRGVKKEKDSS